MRFDLTDLRLFVQVAETCSITRGADQANMSLASASARIRGMEAMLGLSLLERGPRGVRPTPAGQALLHHAQVMLQHHDPRTSYGFPSLSSLPNPKRLNTGKPSPDQY